MSKYEHLRKAHKIVLEDKIAPMVNDKTLSYFSTLYPLSLINLTIKKV